MNNMVDLSDTFDLRISRENFLREDAKFDASLVELKNAVEADYERRPVVLLSGPSGSGKTTTATKLEKLLDADGYETHVISLDNYFRTVTEEERATVDYESPSRVDGELLSEHVRRLVAHEEIEIPEFDFVNTRRGTKTTSLKRGKNEIIIFEGIHALNPKVVDCDDDTTVRVYASVKSKAVVNGCEISPERIRLLRRIVRDERCRGRNAEETIAYADSVTRGEVKFVAPYMYRADFELDTFHGYELSVYKTLLIDELSLLKTKNRVAEEICAFLEKIKGADGNLVPDSSLIREFIG